MNRSIIIFEDTEYTFFLIKERLTFYCPDSYIIKGNHDSFPYQLSLSDSVSVLYDELQYSKEKIIEICSDLGSAVDSINALTTSAAPGIIDCRALAALLSPTAPSRIDIIDKDNSAKGKMILLLPFAYMDERESLIRDSFKKENQQSGNVCIRIDLMSGIRMMFPSIGAMTKILDLARDDKLMASDIVENAAYDDNGFLTLGRPDRSDDVFDHGTECILNLLSKARQLTEDNCYPADILVVAEGLRFSEMTKIAKLADEVHILLPERLYQEDLGFRREIGNITQVLDPKIPVMIRYCEERKPGYETVRI